MEKQSNNKSEKTKRTSAKLQKKKNIKFIQREWEHSVRKQPERLENSSLFYVQSKSAQKIVAGQRRGTAGFYKFSGKVAQIFKGITEDDPFAEYCLAYTCERLMEAIKFLENLKEKVDEKNKQVEGLSLAPYISHDPKGYVIKVKNKYVGLSIRIILLYDQLVRTLYVGVDLSVLQDGEVQDMLRRARDVIRSALNAPFRWYYTGVTRYDVRP